MCRRIMYAVFVAAVGCGASEPGADGEDSPSLIEREQAIAQTLELMTQVSAQLGTKDFQDWADASPPVAEYVSLQEILALQLADLAVARGAVIQDPEDLRTRQQYQRECSNVRSLPQSSPQWCSCIGSALKSTLGIRITEDLVNPENIASCERQLSICLDTAKLLNSGVLDPRDKDRCDGINGTCLSFYEAVNACP